LKIQVKLYNDRPGFCLTTFKVPGRGQYYNRHYSGGWYAAEISMESSRKVSDAVVFEVLDFDKRVLFCESNGNLGAFQSIGDKAKEFARNWASRLALTPYEQWRDWLLVGKPVLYEKDNWLYADTETESISPIADYQHLGITFRLENLLMRHKTTGKIWRHYRIVNTLWGTVTELCGFQFPAG
jgi:hypothetical protein